MCKITLMIHTHHQGRKKTGDAQAKGIAADPSLKNRVKLELSSKVFPNHSAFGRCVWPKTQTSGSSRSKHARSFELNSRNRDVPVDLR